MTRLLLVSLGQLGGALLEAVARHGGFDEIVVATRAVARARAKANNARIGAALEGRYPTIEVVGFDMHAEGAGARLAALAPDLVVAAPSMLPWWALARLPGPKGEAARAAPFATFLPCHLAPMLAFRRAWVASGLGCPWIGASYPDVVNHLLAQDGVAPSCGIGNVAEMVPKVRFVLAESLDAAPAEVSVRLVAAHAFERFLYGTGTSELRPPYLLEALWKGRDVSDAARDALFDPCPIPYELDFNALTASAALAVLDGLCSARPVPCHAPAPGGRLGGYPVTLSRDGVALDLAPAWSEAEAEAVSRACLPFDGIAEVEADGTVIVTDETAQAYRSILGRPLTRLRPREAPAIADELLAALS